MLFLLDCPLLLLSRTGFPRKYGCGTFVCFGALRNVALFKLRFALPHKQQLLGLPAGQHVMVRVPKRGGGFWERPYNPINTDAQPGTVEFLVKVRLEGMLPAASADAKVQECRRHTEACCRLAWEGEGACATRLDYQFE